ncbi:MAG TPA: apolipoprotein N-acyltransferase, partial [Nitrospirae bacterium]|nr:apolipoprotein N-acyltransferase [Nitrospirota bacterium]
KSLYLIQIADITGVYGVSFLVAALNGLLFDLLVNRESKWRTTASVLYAVLLAVVLFYGSGRLAEGEDGREFKVSVIQGNISQDKKWDARFQKEVIDTYKRLTLKAMPEGPDMIVWPETALPFIFGYNEDLTEETLSFQKGLETYLLFGSILLNSTEPGGSSFTNSAVLLSPQGDVASVYDKMHLVPYGEYVPFRNLIPFVRRLTAGIGDFIPGEEYLVMKTPFAKIGNLICYEIIFPGLVRSFVEKGANVLVTITNDAWFGRTSAPYQHFAIAVFRAIENRVPVIRSANTGISGFIDTRGRISKTSDIFVEAVLTEKVAVGTSRSIYTEYGDIFAYLCIAGAMLIIIRNIAYSRPFLETSSSKNF